MPYGKDTDMLGITANACEECRLALKNSEQTGTHVIVMHDVLCATSGTECRSVSAKIHQLSAESRQVPPTPTSEGSTVIAYLPLLGIYQLPSVGVGWVTLHGVPAKWIGGK